MSFLSNELRGARRIGRWLMRGLLFYWALLFLTLLAFSLGSNAWGAALLCALFLAYLWRRSRSHFTREKLPEL